MHPYGDLSLSKIEEIIAAHERDLDARIDRTIEAQFASIDQQLKAIDAIAQSAASDEYDLYLLEHGPKMSSAFQSLLEAEKPLILDTGVIILSYGVITRGDYYQADDKAAEKAVLVSDGSSFAEGLKQQLSKKTDPAQREALQPEIDAFVDGYAAQLDQQAMGIATLNNSFARQAGARSR